MIGWKTLVEYVSNGGEEGFSQLVPVTTPDSVVNASSIAEIAENSDAIEVGGAGVIGEVSTNTEFIEPEV
jgi:carbamate kinase